MFSLMVFFDPLYKQPLVLAVSLPLKPKSVYLLYKDRWPVGVSDEGHIIQSVKVRPRPRDSSLVAWETPWRESKAV